MSSPARTTTRRRVNRQAKLAKNRAKKTRKKLRELRKAGVSLL